MIYIPNVDPNLVQNDFFYQTGGSTKFKGHINHAQELIFLEKIIYFHMMLNKYIFYTKNVALVKININIE